jgi:serine protease DegQ
MTGATMRKLWLGFAQIATILFAALYLASLFRPEPPPRGEVVTVKEAAPGATVPGAAATYSGAAKRAMPAVVNIYTTKQIARRQLSPEELLLRRFYGDQFGGLPEAAVSLGSGVIVSATGYLLTNNHVIEGADEIAVVILGREPVGARVVGTDPETDLAVLKVQAEGLSAITFGDLGRLQVGDVVLAIGNPFGVGQTVTQGIVSATGRSRLGISTFENFIQTDAAINPGNSGGALVDISGNLVGINTAIFSKSEGSVGIGFAIPVNLAKQVLEQIIKQGRVERGWIGVQAQEIAPEAAGSLKPGTVKGALIAGAVRGAPADKAGLRRGDIVTAVNGKPIRDVTDLINATAALKPGERGEFTVLREGREAKLAVEVGTRPPKP